MLIFIIVVFVVLLGMFVIFVVFGYFINILMMFGMVFVIGLFVDDVIVVVEKVECVMMEDKFLLKEVMEKLML